MNALFDIMLFILFLYITLRVIRQVSANKVEACPRCKGTGLLELGQEAVNCRRCKGTGKLTLGYKRK